MSTSSQITMSTSAPSPSDHLAPENFRPLLEALVDQHYRRYSRSVAVSFYWAADNTMAHKDVENFQGILATLGLAPAEEFMIRQSHTIPGWDVQAKIQALVRQAVESNERVLLLVHYAGHGFEKDGSLLFTDAQGHKVVRWDRDFVHLVDLEELAKVDVLFILDSCYSYLGTRQYIPATRVVQVLAAVDENTKFAFGAGNTASFTGKLLNELKARKRAGANSVDLAELISDLREKSPQKKPVHGLLVGNHSLRLAFPGHESGFTAIPPGPATKVVFGFRLAKSLSREAAANFRKWLKDLPKNVGLSLEAVYETSSLYFIFRAPWRLWTQLADYSFTQELCEAKGPNLLLPDPVAPSPEQKKENVRPGSSSKP